MFDAHLLTKSRVYQTSITGVSRFITRKHINFRVLFSHTAFTKTTWSQLSFKNEYARGVEKDGCQFSNFAGY